MKSLNDWDVISNTEEDREWQYLAPEMRYVRLTGVRGDGQRLTCGWIVDVFLGEDGQPSAVETLSGSVYVLGTPAEGSDAVHRLKRAWGRLSDSAGPGYAPGTMACIRAVV